MGSQETPDVVEQQRVSVGGPAGAERPQIPWPSETYDKLIGLVEVPTLFGIYREADPWQVFLPDPPVPVPLHSAPGLDAAVVFTASEPQHLERAEHDYERESAKVFRATRDWYLVAFKSEDVSGRGWLSTRYAGRFRDLLDLFENGSTFLDHRWDGKLYEEPRQSAPVHSVEASRRRTRAEEGLHHTGSYPAHVATVSYVEGEAWALVIVGGYTACAESEPVLGAGWILVHGKDWENIWYYSRGC